MTFEAPGPCWHKPPKRMVKCWVRSLGMTVQLSRYRLPVLPIRMIQTRFLDRSILKISDEVREALRSGRPVVALESTIISHGMPFPQNLETAINVEKAVRDNGAVPATIAVMDGDLCVGINSSELVRQNAAARKSAPKLISLSGRRSWHALVLRSERLRFVIYHWF